jgi:hypothetical protein
LFHYESFESHILHRCSCLWGEDCALRTLYPHYYLILFPIHQYVSFYLDDMKSLVMHRNTGLKKNKDIWHNIKFINVVIHACEQFQQNKIK